MVKWGIEPKHYLIAAVVSFVFAAISFSGIVLANDVVGRLIFGLVWLIVGMGWVGQFFHSAKKEKQ